MAKIHEGNDLELRLYFGSCNLEGSYPRLRLCDHSFIICCGVLVCCVTNPFVVRAIWMRKNNQSTINTTGYVRVT